VFHKPAPNTAIDAATPLPAFRELLQFAQFPLWRVSPAPDVENGTLVELIDVRLGTPESTLFTATATLDSNLRPLRSSLEFGPFQRK
jgi:hypothetical protein